MEIRAYIEGVTYRWWLVVLIALIALIIGSLLGENITAQYTASTNVLINDALLANTAFPSQAVQLNVLASYTSVVMSPQVEGTILKSYPRLTTMQLAKEVVVTVDATNQVMLINVTDASPAASADIANFIARHFVTTQMTSLQNQLAYYQQQLQAQITTLENEINQLNLQIDAATPQRTMHGPPAQLTPAQKLLFTQNVSKVSLDQRKLYDAQQSLLEVQQSLPMVQDAYIILKPATQPTSPNVPPLSVAAYQAIALGVGLLIALCLCIGLDFFTPAVRHRQELAKTVGRPTFAEVPQLASYERKRLLQALSIPLMARLKPLRLLCASMSAIALRQQGSTLLLSSPHKRRKLAAIIATIIARRGLKVLLIDADFAHPTLHQQLPVIGPGEIQTTGQLLPFIGKTAQTTLYLLPANVMLAPDQPITVETLLTLLPTLQKVFDVILIDAPTLEHATTHVLMTKVTQVFLLIQKRRDSLKTLQIARMTCEMLKMEPHYVLLT